MASSTEELRVVGKRFNAGGLDRVSGEVVDAGSFRTLSLLEEQRFLRRLDGRTTLLSCACGRRFIDRTALGLHACQGKQRAAASPATPKPSRTKHRAPAGAGR